MSMFLMMQYFVWGKKRNWAMISYTWVVKRVLDCPVRHEISAHRTDIKSVNKIHKLTKFSVSLVPRVGPPVYVYLLNIQTGRQSHSLTTSGTHAHELEDPARNKDLSLDPRTTDGKTQDGSDHLACKDPLNVGDTKERQDGDKLDFNEYTN